MKASDAACPPAWPCHPCCGPGPSLSRGGVAFSSGSALPLERQTLRAGGLWLLTSQSPLRRRIPRPSASHPHLHSTAFSHRPASSSHLAPIPCWPRPLVGLLWGGKPRASAPQAPTAEGPVAGRGELQSQDGAELLQPCQKYMDFCRSHEAHPVKNHHLRVPSLFWPSAVEPFPQMMLFLKRGLIFTAENEATPTLDGLEVFQGDVNPRSGLDGLRPGPLSSSGAGVGTAPALGFCPGLGRQAKLQRMGRERG